MPPASRLFRVRDPVGISVVPAELETPLGPIGLSLDAGGTALGTPADSCIVADGVHVLAWERPSLQAELLIADVAAELPEGMSVSGCRVGIWRLRAVRAVPSCRFLAVWDGGVAPAEGGPNGGQFLVGQTWDDGEAIVSLGTADAEALARLGSGWETPASWKALVRDEPWDTVIEGYREDGLAIDLPGLEPGEGGQVHFATAWSPARAAEDAATWFAVDLNPRRVTDRLESPRSS